MVSLKIYIATEQPCPVCPTGPACLPWRASIQIVYGVSHGVCAICYNKHVARRGPANLSNNLLHLSPAAPHRIHFSRSVCVSLIMIYSRQPFIHKFPPFFSAPCRPFFSLVF